MRARQPGTSTDLDLAHSAAGRLVDRIAAALGDPAYMHELATVTGEGSRKQYEKAMKALLEQGKAVRYGVDRRRLYATSRSVHPALLDLPAECVRLLQLLPAAGVIHQSMLERGGRDLDNTYFSNATSALRRLAEDGLIIIARTSPRLLALTPKGREARQNLGYGLALEPLFPTEVDDILDTGEAGNLALLRNGGATSQEVGRRSGHFHRFEAKGLMTRIGARWHLTERGRAQDAAGLQIALMNRS